MNVGSGAQIRQLLFAGVQNQKPEKGFLEVERIFKVGLHRFQQSLHCKPSSSQPSDSASHVVAVAHTSLPHLYRCRDTSWLQLRLLNRDFTQKVATLGRLDSLWCTASFKCLLAAARHTRCHCVNLLRHGICRRQTQKGGWTPTASPRNPKRILTLSYTACGASNRKALPLLFSLRSSLLQVLPYTLKPVDYMLCSLPVTA